MATWDYEGTYRLSTVTVDNQRTYRCNDVEALVSSILCDLTTNVKEIVIEPPLSRLTQTSNSPTVIRFMTVEISKDGWRNIIQGSSIRGLEPMRKEFVPKEKNKGIIIGHLSLQPYQIQYREDVLWPEFFRRNYSLSYFLNKENSDIEFILDKNEVYGVLSNGKKIKVSPTTQQRLIHNIGGKITDYHVSLSQFDDTKCDSDGFVIHALVSDEPQESFEDFWRNTYIRD